MEKSASERRRVQSGIRQHSSRWEGEGLAGAHRIHRGPNHSRIQGKWSCNRGEGGLYNRSRLGRLNDDRRRFCIVFIFFGFALAIVVAK